jgi:hypothetical protein
VVSRILKRAQRLLGEQGRGMNQLFRDRTRSAKRLVLQGEKVAASEKVVSLFEPHTAVIWLGLWQLAEGR